ncbi:MAG TPA: arylsulfotransferase family protein [Gemmatimonadaceae bacterium]|nr:arylsulfotransferase family protein [Gemmatimonadaceae bacterium]
MIVNRRVFSERNQGDFRASVCGPVCRPMLVPVLVLAALAGACAGGDGVAPKLRVPVISPPSVAANAYNTLSTVVSFSVTDADSARVVYWSAEEAARTTPYQRIQNSAGQILVLGLRPATSYTVAVEAAGSTTARSTTIDVVTAALPQILQGVHLVTTGTPSTTVSPGALAPGFTLVVPEFFGDGTAGYLLAFDSAGELRWYRAFEGQGGAVEAKQQRNGDFTVYLGRSFGWQPTSGRYVQVRPSGEIVRSFAVTAPFYTDPHEMLLTFGDSAIEAVHLLGYHIQPFDLTAWGERPDVPLAVHVIERQNALGAREFLWDAGDHFTPADWPARTPLQGDLVHPSSLDRAPDGNYVVSFQAMDEIAKIDANTGRTIWRFGGRNNQFAIEGDPRGGFHGQHSVRVLANGNLLLLDNHTRAAPLQARAVEYSLDTVARVARLVWEYEPVPPVASPVMGSVQRLANGNTVVGFAATGRAVEVDRSGGVVWAGALQDGMGALMQFYRALRIGSLYTYVRP